MSWTEIDKASVDPEAATKQNNKKRQQISELAKAYHRCLTSEDGARVLADLSKRFIYDNNTSFSSSNIGYEAAYHNGEAGVVKFLINQLQQAEIV
jgi:hypothetical protein